MAGLEADLAEVGPDGREVRLRRAKQIDALRARNPELVYVSISGFGREGPYASQRVYDNVIQTFSGMAAVQREGEEPRPLRQLACDKITALTTAQAISTALLARARGRSVRLKAAEVSTRQRALRRRRRALGLRSSKLTRRAVPAGSERAPASCRRPVLRNPKS